MRIAGSWRYWMVALACADLVWQALRGILLRVVLVRLPPLEAGAAARGGMGFAAGVLIGLLVVLLFIVWIMRQLSNGVAGKECGAG